MRHPFVTGQPLIYEDVIDQTKTIHLLVVWDAFVRLAPADRSRMILHAYSEVRPSKASRITVAMGVTADEAIDLGLLPYSIVPMVKRGEIDGRLVAKALRDAGAIKTSAGLELRFHRLDEAQDAYRKIQSELPGPFWTLSREERVGA